MARQGSGDAISRSRVVRLAKLLDSRFRIPGTPLRFGLDAIIGLIPGAGDVITAALSLLILLEAYRLGVSRGTLIRMALNVLLDAVVGSVPILGDIFDVAFKANLRNVRLMEKDERERMKGKDEG